MDNKQVVEYRICVCGCRNYYNYQFLSEYLDYILSRLKNEGRIVILSGCASGVDTLAIKYANYNDYECRFYKPNTTKYGKSGYFLRNYQMVQDCTHVVAFWDGSSKGTKMTIELAKRYNKPIKIKYISCTKE